MLKFRPRLLPPAIAGAFGPTGLGRLLRAVASFPIVYYWVGGTGTWNGVSKTNWSTASGGPGGAGPPSAGDDVVIDVNSGSGTITTAAGAACRNLTISGTAVKTNVLSLGVDFAPTGLLAINGNSATNRILIQSSVLGTQRTITVGAAPTLSNIDFMDIAAAGAGGTWAGTSMGDCLGNSGITFDASSTQTATGTASFTWSTHGWTTRVPLPQDDVVINNAFVAGRTISIDMPRIGRSINFTGATGTPTVDFGGVIHTCFGSVTLISSLTLAGTTGGFNIFARSSVNLTSAGLAFGRAFTFNGPGGTLNCLDAFSCGDSSSIQNGTWNTGGFSFTCSGRFDMGAPAPTFNAGASVMTFTGATQGWTFLGGTFNAGTSTIKYTDSTGSAKIFAGGGKTYNNLWFNSTGAGFLQITSANTFNDVKIDKGLVVQLPASTTNTLTTFSPQGAAPSGDAQFAQLFGVAGGYFSSPDSVAASVTGDIDIQVNVACDWTAIGQTFVNKCTGQSGTASAYRFGLHQAVGSRLGFTRWDGTAFTTVFVSTSFVSGAQHWIRVTRNATTGDVIFYTCPTEDGVTWVQLGATQATVAGNLQDTADPVEIGSTVNGSAFNVIGRIFRAKILNGIAGTLAVDFNPATYTTGTTWTSATSEVWTINGNAMVSATNMVGLGSSGTTNAPIAKSGGGKVKVDYLSLARSTASPTFTFYDFTHGLDQGNNVNWQFYNPDYVLAGAAGAFTETGVAAKLLKGYRVAAGAGAFTMAGQAASLLKTWKLTAGAGAFVLSGQSASLLKGYRVAGAAGAFVLNGIAAGLNRQYRLTASAGVFAFTGFAIAFARSYRITAAPGSFLVNGQPVLFTHGYPPSEQFAVVQQEQIVRVVDPSPRDARVADASEPRDAIAIDNIIEERTWVR